MLCYFYCLLLQSDKFLKAVASTEVSYDLIRHTANKLKNVAVFLLAAYYPTDELEANAPTDLNLLLCLDVPAVRDLTPLPTSRPKDHLIRFSYCQFQFASFLANLSLLPEAINVLSMSCK